ncbi:MAG: outer membrane protein assembly factor BamE [Rickettsiales bacterium]
MNKKHTVKLTAIIGFIFLSSCSPKVEDRGYVKSENWKDEIKLGETSKNEVLGRFGSPSAKSTFGKETWYYISARKEAVAFMAADVVEQDTVSLSFNDSGVVDGIKFYNKDNAKDIEMVGRTTPTEGHSLSFIDQTLGNLGRFNNPNGTARNANRRPY